MGKHFIEYSRVAEACDEDAAHAWVLFRIAHWQRYAKIPADGGGAMWVVKTQEEWAQECGISIHKIRRYFEALREGGLIETKKAQFGSLLGVNFVRLTKSTLIQLGMK